MPREIDYDLIGSSDFCDACFREKHGYSVIDPLYSGDGEEVYIDDGLYVPNVLDFRSTIPHTHPESTLQKERERKSNIKQRYFPNDNCITSVRTLQSKIEGKVSMTRQKKILRLIADVSNDSDQRSTAIPQPSTNRQPTTISQLVTNRQPSTSRQPDAIPQQIANQQHTIRQPSDTIISQPINNIKVKYFEFFKNLYSSLLYMLYMDNVKSSFVVMSTIDLTVSCYANVRNKLDVMNVNIRDNTNYFEMGFDMKINSEKSDFAKVDLQYKNVVIIDRDPGPAKMSLYKQRPLKMSYYKQVYGQVTDDEEPWSNRYWPYTFSVPLRDDTIDAFKIGDHHNKCRLIYNRSLESQAPYGWQFMSESGQLNRPRIVPFVWGSQPLRPLDFVTEDRLPKNWRAACDEKGRIFQVLPEDLNRPRVVVLVATTNHHGGAVACDGNNQGRSSFSTGPAKPFKEVFAEIEEAAQPGINRKLPKFGKQIYVIPQRRTPEQTAAFAKYRPVPGQVHDMLSEQGMRNDTYLHEIRSSIIPYGFKWYPENIKKVINRQESWSYMDNAPTPSFDQGSQEMPKFTHVAKEELCRYFPY